MPAYRCVFIDMDVQRRLEELMTGYLEDRLSAQDTKLFMELLRALPPEEVPAALLRDLWDFQLASAYDFEAADRRMRAQVLSRIGQGNRSGRVRRMVRLGWAAAVLLLLAGAALVYRQGIKHGSAGKVLPLTARDIGPGKQGAILTLDDGRQVMLDSMGDGPVAVQGGAAVTKKDGQLAYSSGAGVAAYNTITTPKGRQFRVRLPDGTQVWLNAASYIRYPTAFTGPRRSIELGGEAYLEVANNRIPFSVKIGARAEVDVLGTHFDINAYTNEPFIKTTLTEGSVLVKDSLGRVLLHTGEQAQIDGSGRLSVNRPTDLEKALAWKNGVFNFEYTHLDEAMRQLERWYDIEVVYENGVPDITFYGRMSMDLSLSETLSDLEKTGVHFRLEEGRKLIVTP